MSKISDNERDDTRPDEDDPDMGDLFDDLSDLEAMVDSPEERDRVREAMHTASEVQEEDQPIFGRVVWGFDRADLAEALLGALLFGIPMAVEDGTIEAGEFIAANPLFLGVTLAAGITIPIGLLYVAEIQDVRVAYAIFGLVPRRLVGVIASSFVTAVLLFTAWGRVDWADPWVSFCVCSIAFVPMVIGAALGDILPGT